MLGFALAQLQVRTFVRQMSLFANAVHATQMLTAGLSVGGRLHRAV